MNKKKWVGLLGGIFALILAALGGSQMSNLGSVQQGSDYTSTSTGATIGLPAELLVTGPGALGSVVITGALSGEMNFYNATTTNILERLPARTTSSMV